MGSLRVRHDWCDLAAAAAWCTLNKILFLYAPFSQNKDRQIINTYLICECYIEYMTISTSFDTHLMISSVQSLRCVRLFVTPRTAAHQASLSITNSWNLLKFMSIKSVMPSNHLILCHHLLLLPSILLSIRVFSNESVLCIGWPKYWSFSISPSNEH